MTRVRVLPAGRNAVIVEGADKETLNRLWRLLRYGAHSGVEDVIVGARTVGVIVSPGSDPHAVIQAALGRMRLGETTDSGFTGRLAKDRVPQPGGSQTGGSQTGESQPDGSRSESAAPRTVTIPVDYDGPDLEPTAADLGMPPAEIARRHSASTWTVDFLGFSPGFAYLSGGDPALWVPRLSSPRLSVPAGSVAIAAGMTAVYPQPTPGGWRIIGSTQLSLFDAREENPSLLQPGDRVLFRASVLSGGTGSTLRRTTSSRAPASSRPGMGVSSPATGDARAAGPSTLASGYVKVLDAGAGSTVQDCGRRGYGHLGVPRAGAADASSAAQANALVGNPATSALIESLVAPATPGLVLRLGAPRTVAVSGARSEVTVDGIPARQDVPLHLGAGAELRLGRGLSGLRVYVAVAGGIDVEPVLGSRSTDTLSGLGPSPLQPGDVLALGAPGESTHAGPAFPKPAFPTPGEVICLGVTPGPRYDWLDRSGRETLKGTPFEVSSAADRTGVRLAGPPVTLTEDAQLPSEALVAGAVEVAGGGSAIVMLRNHPTTGGYPVVAVVDDPDVDLLAQCAPGVRIRFDFHR
ncbi:MAG: carboxyltransferase domain-containing protein [Acidimicrobiales bacterium]